MARADVAVSCLLPKTHGPQPTPQACVRQPTCDSSSGGGDAHMETPTIRLVRQRTDEPAANLVVIVPNEVVRHGLDVILKSVTGIARAHFCRDVWEAYRLVDAVAADLVLSCVG